VSVTIDDHEQLPPKAETLGVGEVNVKFPTWHLGTSAKLVLGPIIHWQATIKGRTLRIEGNGPIH
jgi:hypothetical protein